MPKTNRSLSFPLLVALLAAGFGVGRSSTAPPSDPQRGSSAVEEARASAQQLSAAFQDLSQRAGRAVVSVRADVRSRRGPYRRLAQGSGVIVDSKGLVVTNHHVIQGADRVTAFLWDGTELAAEIVGVDGEADLALLRVEHAGLASLAFADKEGVQVGEWVLALGNPLGYGPSVTAGIVSGTGRADIDIATYEDFIQTDAAINPGNSGGPLVDLDGRLVGINTAMGTGPGGNLGIGFAIPGPMVESIIAELLEEGRVRRGWLGIEMDPVTDDAARALGFDGLSRVAVKKVRDKSPAAAAGIAQGDLIVAIHGQAVQTSRDLLNAIGEVEPGTEVTIVLWRGGRELGVLVTLAERSPDVLLEAQGE